MRLIAILILGLFGSVAFAQNSAPNWTEISAVLDSVRKGGSDVVINNQTTVVGKGGSSTTQDFTVYVNSDDRVIVETKSGAQRGQKILVTADSVWLYSPKTKRAIRIPLAQRLYGDANISDIANLRWSRKYSASGAVTAETKDGRSLWRVNLTARQAGEPFPRITLWVNKGSLTPHSASFLLPSGKLGRSAVYDKTRVQGGRLTIDQWSVTSAANPQRRTVIKLVSVAQRNLPDIWFTRQHLETGR
jgi:outer membrane lipoprotein-sorting protein